MEPPEKNRAILQLPEGVYNPGWVHRWEFPTLETNPDGTMKSLGDSWQDYHLAPEIFVSDGTPDSIVGQWVARRDGVGGIHHLAYQVDSVQDKMNEWKEKGYAEFSSDKPMTCPDLTQVFTKPSVLTGVIYEFIERGKHGFCQDNVKELMISTKNADSELKARVDHQDAIVSGL